MKIQFFKNNLCKDIKQFQKYSSRLYSVSFINRNKHSVKSDYDYYKGQQVSGRIKSLVFIKICQDFICHYFYFFMILL